VAVKFRLEWLAEYLPGETPDAKALGQRLTDIGFILEGIEGDGPTAVLDVEVTPNRPDAMNHRGIALEAALALDRAFLDPEAKAAVPEEGAAASDLASVTIEEPELCSRYSSRVLEGIAMRGSSPKVAERLAAIGSGVISGPVDATNHVLWDVGQPLHAFDLDKLAKGPDGKPAIIVRRARKGEKLFTLDGVERVLTPEMLVIADHERPVALAGVMGGLETMITLSTRRVLLESAHFSATSVRRTARALGMHTDASHRFERGTDPGGTAAALDRAARLIVACCGGSVRKGVIDAVARRVEPRTLRLRFPRLARFLGLEVSKERTVAILEALGIRVLESSGDVFACTIPTARVDLTAEVDLFEEVIRHVGYGKLPETLPAAFVPTYADPVLEREERVRDVLAGAGFTEAQSYSFISASENAPFETLAPGAPVAIENPLGEPFEILRATPLVGVLRAAQHNVRRGARDLSLFEVGRAFGRRNGSVMEPRRVSFLLLGERGVHVSTVPVRVDFFDGSGVVAGLFRGLGLEAPSFSPAKEPFLAPGRAARVLAPGGRDVGWVGVLSSALCQAWELDEPVAGELDLEAIPKTPPLTSVEAPPRFPGSDFDLTVTHRLSVPFVELASAARSSAPPELAAVDAVARYQGAGVAEGHVKTTLRFRFRSSERSLSREELSLWRDEAASRFLALGRTSVDGYPPKEVV
jgi:phenylalanyl-tRNA synthetase beta chain